ncbi:hypothetical protein B0H16DRAFT_1732628 [Mycena metata]|uniref:RING-type E3 ubiquitin transferase n=1 Tax=Mycena metata TaxID=1033252 RepID=A0AAD7MVV3_9AGAR|nr:hypothetical protein B0H16DRAFT_1732628 [Mycena metata]
MLSPRKASTSSAPPPSPPMHLPHLRCSPGGGIIYPGIMGGPPLLIKSTAPLRSVLLTRTTTTTRAARAAATAGPSQQASRRRSAPRSPRPVDRTRVRVPTVPLHIIQRRGPSQRHGIRAVRAEPLIDADLYVTETRPAADVDPGDTTIKPFAHHVCAICLGPKSHLVTTPCGHTYCYVCIRKSLESSWHCPSCRRLITSAPVHNYDLQTAIAHDHPRWVDQSQVSFSWGGLEWPLEGPTKFPLQPDLETLLIPSSSDPDFLVPLCLEADGRWLPKPRRQIGKSFFTDTQHKIVNACVWRHGGACNVYALSIPKSLSHKVLSRNTRLRARVADAKYRERQIHTADKLRRAKHCLEEHGAEALDEHLQHAHLARTQKRHEGRPPTPRPTPPTRNWRALRRMRLEEESNPPTENQRRCRALRRMGLEEDNSDDSDEDLPEGVCGCNLSECQRPHRNETVKRKEWKLFHLKYDNDGNVRKEWELLHGKEGDEVSERWGYKSVNGKGNAKIYLICTANPSVHPVSVKSLKSFSSRVLLTFQGLTERVES